MTLKEAIQKDGQRHLYVKSSIASGTTQYIVNEGPIDFVIVYPLFNKVYWFITHPVFGIW